MDKSNVGVLTGKINNLVVIDICVKDNGMNEWCKYIKEHDDPQTVKVRTPSGWYHYYFKYASTDKRQKELIENYLTNKT